MNKEIIVSSKTLDEAITDALVQLGVTSDKLDYEVIEKGSAGFLGIGMKQAVIKAWKKSDKEEKPNVKIEKSEKDIIKEGLDEVNEDNSEVSHVLKESNKESKYSNRNYHTSSKPYEHKDNGFRGNKYEAAREEKYSIHKDEVLVPVEPKTLESAKNFVDEVLAAMGLEEAGTNAYIDAEGAIAIDITGEKMGLLIGKRGQTLDSLQYLTNRVANKMQEGYVRVKLDTEDYRKRRVETLEKLAHNVASKVKRTKRRYVLEPMNPYERRIIHSALQGEHSITTYSEGEEPYRKVVVSYVRNRR
ncbi:MAG: Jag N-terminal domain-containing protein [Lachnospiraceae bacterium]|jgi:spoIIIJ-associated protein|nr:Jag N-terminal domain-containing protein [Lachnospiraceae bacterium]